MKRGAFARSSPRPALFLDVDVLTTKSMDLALADALFGSLEEPHLFYHAWKSIRGDYVLDFLRFPIKIDPRCWPIQQKKGGP